MALKDGLLAGMMLLLLLSAGCVGYRLGSTLPPGIQTIFVPTFVNEAKEPQLEAQTTRAAIQEFQRDGTLRVVGREAADTVAEVTLTGFSLAPLRYREDRALTVREYRLKIFARLVLTQLRPQAGQMLDKEVEGEATFELTGDLSAAKRAALPEAARDLAHDIVESVVEYW